MSFLQVVIKYVPYVGDSKRAMDEYTSEIMMGGTNTIALHNTCEVSVFKMVASVSFATFRASPLCLAEGVEEEAQRNV